MKTGRRTQLALAGALTLVVGCAGVPSEAEATESGSSAVTGNPGDDAVTEGPAADRRARKAVARLRHLMECRRPPFLDHRAREDDPAHEQGDDAGLDEDGSDDERPEPGPNGRRGARASEREDRPHPGEGREDRREARAERGEARAERGEDRAEHRDPPPGPRGRRGLPPMLRRAYDLDADGRLNDTEREALAADLEAGCRARRDRLIAAHDADRDGQLSDDELKAAARALRAQVKERKAGFDENGDGRLDRAERRAIREGRREQVLMRFDANHDGTLDAGERARFREAVRERVRNGEPPGP